jgi:alpha-tubulin suppressor-like RCC1 family protein
MPAAASSASAGQLYAFGDNEGGQLGNPTNDTNLNPNPVPALVALTGATGPVVQVAAGEQHTLAVTSTGELFAFGSNEQGQLGIDANVGTSTPNPTPAQVMLTGTGGDVVRVAAGEDHSLAVTSSGLLYAFGWNFSGQLGIADNAGTTAPNATPTLVTLPGAVGGVTEVAAGHSHSLAVTSSGQLYAFGANDFGQLGNDKVASTATPAPVGLPGAVGPVVEVAAGSYHSLAVTASGQLYAFGRNDDGQLGSSANLGNTNPNPTPALVTLPGALGGVVQAAAGERFSLALTSAGQVYAFGRNDHGQLGTAAGNPNATPTLVSFPGATGRVVRVAAGWSHGLALTSTGQLFGFGFDLDGELTGVADSVPTPTVISIAGGSTVDTMALGPTAFHTLAVTANLSVATTSLPTATVGAAYRAGLQADGGSGPLRWSAAGLPPGLSIEPDSGLVSGTPTAGGSFEPSVTVTDHDGITASRTLTIAVDSAPASLPGSTATPRLSALTISPRTFTLHGRVVHGRCVAATRANQTKRRCIRRPALAITYSLTRPTTVAFMIERVTDGRLARGRCTAPTRANRRGRRCMRLFAIGGGFTHLSAAGANRLTFTGRLGGGTLGPGRYELIATPAGGVSASSTFALSP